MVKNLPASHLERMLWNFIKNYFLAGFILFFTISLLPLTIYTAVVMSLIYYGYIGPEVLLFQGIILLFLGLLLRNKIINLKVSTVLTIILIGLLVIDYFNLIPNQITTIMALEANYSFYFFVILLTAWLIFNSSYIIIETAEFFASTTGLLVLLGSDDKHIFLSPIPQLIALSALLASLYFYSLNKLTIIQLTLIDATILIQLLLIYVFFRDKGRIVRSSYAFFTAFSSYLALALFFNQNYAQATAINIVITIITVLFMMQSRMKKITTLVTTQQQSKQQGVQTPLAILMVYGTIFIVLPIIKNMSAKGSTILPVIWQLNIVAALISAILIAFYWKFSTKLAFYQKRDKISTKDLIIETSLILGSKFLEELMKIAKIEAEQKIKVATEKASDVARKINETVEKIRKKLSKFFKT